MTALTAAQLAPLYRRLLKLHPYDCWIYAIQAGEDGPIKIGITEDPAQRLATLQQGNAVELRGIAAWRAWRVEEKQIHEEFAYARVRGEWFRPVSALIEFVLCQGRTFCDWEPA